MTESMFTVPVRPSHDLHPPQQVFPADSMQPLERAILTARRAPARYRGLHLVKGRDGVVTVAAPQPPASLWRTRSIVAQVEKEVAALAERRRSQHRDRVVSPALPPAPTRTTPWSVLGRVVRELYRGLRRTA